MSVNQAVLFIIKRESQNLIEDLCVSVCLAHETTLSRCRCGVEVKVKSSQTPRNYFFEFLVCQRPVRKVPSFGVIMDKTRRPHFHCQYIECTNLLCLRSGVVVSVEKKTQVQSDPSSLSLVSFSSRVHLSTYLTYLDCRKQVVCGVSNLWNLLRLSFDISYL